MIGAPALAAVPAPAAEKVTVTKVASDPEVFIIRSGTGRVLRAKFYDSPFRYSGDRIEYYGSGPCSTTTKDADFSMSVMPRGWDNRISSIQDFSSCDVKLYWDGGFKGDSTDYVNYGNGKHLGLRWSNDASSFRVS